MISLVRAHPITEPDYRSWVSPYTKVRWAPTASRCVAERVGTGDGGHIDSLQEWAAVAHNTRRPRTEHGCFLSLFAPKVDKQRQNKKIYQTEVVRLRAESAEFMEALFKDNSALNKALAMFNGAPAYSERESDLIYDNDRYPELLAPPRAVIEVTEDFWHLLDRQWQDQEWLRMPEENGEE